MAPLITTPRNFLQILKIKPSIKMKTSISTLKTLIALIVVGSVSFLGCSSNENEQSINASVDKSPIQVSSYTIGNAGSTVLIPVGGQVVASERTYINAKTNGFVASVLVELGQSVKKDQLLASIENEELGAKKAQVTAMVSEASAGFVLAEKEYQRMTRLAEAGSATARELDMATSQYNRAKAGLQQAEKALEEVNTMLSYTQIKAPFSGSITEKMIDEGALIDPSRPLFVLENNAAPEVQVFVPTSLHKAMEIGDVLTIQVEGEQNTYEATVSELSNSASQNGGQFSARLTLKNAAALYNGSYAKVFIPQNAASKAKVVIPENALISRGALVGAYVISKDGKALLRWIRTGKTFENQVEVLSGLSAGEQIILDVPATVEDGSYVTAL